jgi:hypothetical protein
MKRLVELRGRLASVAEGEDPGIAAVKEEGRRIIAAREMELAEQGESPSPAPVEEPVEKSRKKRGGRNDDVV